MLFYINWGRFSPYWKFPVVGLGWYFADGRNLKRVQISAISDSLKPTLEGIIDLKSWFN